jgi:hypothetical protein
MGEDPGTWKTNSLIASAIKNPPGGGFDIGKVYQQVELTLGELGSASGASKTILLPFLHSRITSEEPIIAEGWEVLFAHADQSTGQTHSNGAGLAHWATAGNADDDVDLVAMTNMVEGLDDLATLGICDEVLVELAIIDRDLTAPGSHTNSGYRSFAASGTEAVTADLVFLYEHRGINSKSGEWERYDSADW